MKGAYFHMARRSKISQEIEKEPVIKEETVKKTDK